MRKRLLIFSGVVAVLAVIALTVQHARAATVYGSRFYNLVQLYLVSTTDTAPVGWAQFVYDTTTATLTPRNSSNTDISARKTGTIQFSLYESAGIATGVKLTSCAHVESSGTISLATLLVAPSGTFTAEILKTTYTAWDAGGTHPVTGDKISASAPVTVTSGTKSQDATLTGWTKTVAAGDIICANVTAATTVTTAHISLRTVRGLD